MKSITIILIIMFLLNSCQQRLKQETTESLSTIYPTLLYMTDGMNETQTPKWDLTPMTRPTPITSIQTLPEAGISENKMQVPDDSIWVYLLDKKMYYVTQLTGYSAYVNNPLENKNTYATPNTFWPPEAGQEYFPPLGCRAEAIPETTKLICQDTDGSYFLYDLITHETEYLRTPGNTQLVYWTPTGDNLYFLAINPETKLSSIHSYNIETKTKTQIASEIDGSKWLSYPYLTDDLSTFYVVTDFDKFRLVKYEANTQEYLDITPEGMYVSPSNISIAPHSSMVIFGATDRVYEIPQPVPDKIFWYDKQTPKPVPLDLPANIYLDYGWPRWSKDGEKFLFLAENQICEFVLDLRKSTCYKVNLDGESINIFWPRWSPDGTNIAFITYEGGNPDSYRLAVLNTLDGSIDLVIENGIMHSVFWR